MQQGMSTLTDVLQVEAKIANQRTGLQGVEVAFARAPLLPAEDLVAAAWAFVPRA